MYMALYHHFLPPTKEICIYIACTMLFLIHLYIAINLLVSHMHLSDPLMLLIENTKSKVQNKCSISVL